MRLGALMTAIAGLAVAGGSVYLARDYIRIEPQQAEAAAESPTVAVIVAAHDIAFGETIDARSLTTIDWPRDSVPPGIFTDYTALLAQGDQPPRRARRPIAQGELLLQTKVSDFGEKVTIVQTLSPENRAMAISVDAVTGVGGFVTPGDRVDIVLTQGGGGNMRAYTILQNIRVVGVDQQINEENDSPNVARTVTVEVTPDQSQRLALAQRAGNLSLTLRALDDKADRELTSTSLLDLMNKPSEEGKARPTIRVRRGTELTEAVVN